jgi:hypothetical protein
MRARIVLCVARRTFVPVAAAVEPLAAAPATDAPLAAFAPPAATAAPLVPAAACGQKIALKAAPMLNNTGIGIADPGAPQRCNMPARPRSRLLGACANAGQRRRRARAVGYSRYTLAPKPLCEHCGLTALFVPYSETVPRRCAAHRHPTDGTHRRRWCRHPGCAVLPSYAPPGEAPLYCLAHRKNGFVNVRSGRPEHRPKLRKVRPPAPPPIVYTYVPPWPPRTPNVKLWRAPLPPLIDIRTGRIIEDA